MKSSSARLIRMHQCVLLFGVLLFFLITQCSSHCGRTKRVIYFDTESNIDVAIQITVPFGIALPTVKKKKGRQSRRGTSDERKELFKGESGNQTHTPALNRLEEIFSFLEVCSEECRLKLLCEVTAEPEKYFPVGEIFKSQLAVVSGEGQYFQYLLAASQGLRNSSACDTLYGSCPKTAHSYFDMDALNVWKFLAAVFRIRFS
ncbi:uncharacterized protein [Anabrus simplex]|uniref:uncharacterized protein n=1 Tax=Anabrus simplex TaxID=316456 RepID=UPI0035A2D78C